MKAMILNKPGEKLALIDIDIPTPLEGQVLIKINACGLCRTDLHVVDGDLTEPKLPIIPGHQIVGVIADSNGGYGRFKIDDRVGVPWLGYSCGECSFCDSGRENLCNRAGYTGYQINGGFAEYCVADERFCFPIPEDYPDIQAAPLLCAGLIGYRALRMCGNARILGFYGFGASAHILIQLARYEEKQVYAFTREGDIESQKFAFDLGAVWAGSSDEIPPVKLDAAIIFASVGELVPKALKALDKGGICVCAGIHMSDIPSFPYSLLWEERSLKSVANLTRQDGEEFFKLAPKAKVKTETHRYKLKDTNEALDDLRNGRFNGAAVIVVDEKACS